MIKGIGVDIIEIGRIRKAVDRWQENFLERIFTPEELAYCWYEKRHYQSLAARFAAKEAAAKALGYGMAAGISWLDFSVGKDERGKPCLSLLGHAKILAEKQGVEVVHLSLSHCQTYAVAQVICEGGE